MSHTGNASGGGHHGGEAHHVTPLSVYTNVFGSLIVLTAITVGASYVNMGELNTLIAMIIATIKAMLVILFFMGMKYEGKENNVAFFCSFGFLAIFVGLTASDILNRVEQTPVRIDATGAGAQSGEPVDVAKMIKPTPDLVAKGKAIYAQNCVTCHGNEGKGDGPAAAALTPHPRNFTSDQGWKFGRGVAKIVHTIGNGSPGTGMPPFTGIPADDRFALAHYVRTFMANAPGDEAADVATLTKELGTKPKPHISIERALDKTAEDWERAHPHSN